MSRRPVIRTDEGIYYFSGDETVKWRRDWYVSGVPQFAMLYDKEDAAAEVATFKARGLRAAKAVHVATHTFYGYVREEYAIKYTDLWFGCGVRFYHSDGRPA